MCYWKISKNLSAPHVEMISSYLEKKLPHVLSRLFNLLMRFNFSALLPLLLLLAHAEKYVEHEFSLFHILYIHLHFRPYIKQSLAAANVQTCSENPKNCFSCMCN